jgi:predicted secreted protein
MMAVRLCVGRLRMREIQLTEANRGESCELHRNDVIVIHLAENRTTPYRWEITKFDDKILAHLKLDADYLPPKIVGDPKDHVGMEGTRIFKFKAKTAGTSLIQLKLWFERLKDDPYIRFFDVTAVVSD